MKIIIILLSFLICNVGFSDEMHVGDTMLSKHKHNSYGSYYKDNNEYYFTVHKDNIVCSHNVFFEHACQNNPTWNHPETIPLDANSWDIIARSLTHIAKEYIDEPMVLRSICAMNSKPHCDKMSNREIAFMGSKTIHDMDNIFDVMP